MEMAHSIESRPPFLDHVLVDYVNEIPTHIKLQQGREKYILREAVKPYVTEELYNRIKQPFIGPPTKKRTKMDDYLESILRGPELKAVSWIDQKKVIEWLDNKSAIPEKSFDQTRILLASFSVIQKRYNVD